jgi:hypothetical protein
VEDAFAQQVEVGAAEHLTLNHLDLVVVALDRAGARAESTDGSPTVAHHATDHLRSRGEHSRHVAYSDTDSGSPPLERR